MRKSVDFINLASSKRFEDCMDRFIALYNESQDLGDKAADIVISMQKMVIRGINARAKLAQATDEYNFSGALEAEKDLTESIAEVKLFLHEMKKAGKTE